MTKRLTRNNGRLIRSNRPGWRKIIIERKGKGKIKSTEWERT